MYEHNAVFKGAVNSTVKESLTYTYKIVPKEGVLGCCAFAAFADGCRVEGRSISPYTAEVDHTSSSLATSHRPVPAADPKVFSFLQHSHLFGVQECPG